MSDDRQSVTQPNKRPLLSVIIPLGPDESGLGRLAADLLLLPAESEIILVCCASSQTAQRQFGLPPKLISGALSELSPEPLPEQLPGQLPEPLPEKPRQPLQQRPTLRWLEAPTGRACQLNAGARAARGEHLWFLHADSGICPWVVSQLFSAIVRSPNALHFFRLAFAPDGAGPMALNAQGANLRSAWLGVPFGDQGFCLSAELFRRIGGYDEQASYGEDHLLVWQARRAGIELDFCSPRITTSARKYLKRGWGGLTLRYQWLWIKQALPQAWALFRGR